MSEQLKDTPKSKCPICLHYGNVEGRRRLTAYEDDRKNHILSCYKCFKGDCDAMEEMWGEYKASVGFGDYDY